MANINRRRFLISASVLPMLSILPSQAVSTQNKAQSKVHVIEGTVFINKRQLDSNTVIQSGDEIIVSHDGKLIFSMGEDAFLMRGGSVLQVRADSNLLVASLRLLTGAMLGVFGKRTQATHIYTPNATIGIRGTAVYVDASPNLLYTCTCYGHTDLIVGNEREDVIATHHHAHVVTTTKAGKSQMQAFEVKDHNDDELRMLEALVGRKPSFDA